MEKIFHTNSNQMKAVLLSDKTLSQKRLQETKEDTEYFKIWNPKRRYNNYTHM